MERLDLNLLPLRGILLRLTATFLMAAMSACVHAAAQKASLGQIVFWRSAIAILPIVIYAALTGPGLSALKPKTLNLHVTRGLLGCGTMFLSFLSLAYLPVALATALSYLVPLFSIPFAVKFLGERFDRRIVVAILLGLLGVLLMLVPAFENPAANYALIIGTLAGLGYALTMGYVRVHIKTMTSTETTASIALSFAIICTLVGLSTLPFGWNIVDNGVMAALVGAGLLGGLGHIASTEALRQASVAVLAPFEYTGMIWALLFDIFIFAYRPDIWSMGGVVLIVAAALVTVFADRIFATREAPMR